MKNLLFTFLFATLSFMAIGQQDQSLSANKTKSQPNTSVYLTYGTVFTSAQGSIALDQAILSKNDLQTRLKLHYGKYFFQHADLATGAEKFEYHTGLSLVQLISFLELNVGAVYTSYTLARGFEPKPDVDYEKIRNSVKFYRSVGIRLGKGNFLFRAGIGNLEMLYIGVGINF